ncbi:MAG: phosphoribosylformylglycinamidine synthase subunit PurQ [Bacteriovoracaceae bacterium]|nr:phosphoribosylformylglycinamidine synthase subunit PurQ [Bacteroidota bacterium]
MSQSTLKFGVVVFPGSNCDHDAYHTVKHVMGHQADFLWHKEQDLKNSDVIILPGGFSYGDYLRTGAIARFSPIMKEVIAFAKNGGVVVGICNGFQILCESGLLPGVLLRNRSLLFSCKHVNLRVEHSESRYTNAMAAGDILSIPIAHGEGNYFAEPETIRVLEENGQVLFRYCDEFGAITDESNPNGSINNIAGIMNSTGTVMGMMPHPERACEPQLVSTDGKRFFESLINSFVLQSA